MSCLVVLRAWLRASDVRGKAYVTRHGGYIAGLGSPPLPFPLNPFVPAPRRPRAHHIRFSRRSLPSQRSQEIFRPHLRANQLVISCRLSSSSTYWHCFLLPSSDCPSDRLQSMPSLPDTLSTPVASTTTSSLRSAEARRTSVASNVRARR
jgi:hypothetical protein